MSEETGQVFTKVVSLSWVQKLRVGFLDGRKERGIPNKGNHVNKGPGA